MGSVERVPSMADGTGESYTSRLEQYVNAIRATARVFEQSNTKQSTRASYDGYMCWINSWAQLSGFETLIVVNHEVGEVACQHSCGRVHVSRTADEGEVACRLHGRRLRSMHQHKVEGALMLTDVLDHACFMV